MAENVLMKILQEVPEDWDYFITEETLRRALVNINELYSYIVYKKNNKFVVQCNIAQDDRYNTINTNIAIIHIVNSIYEKDCQADDNVLCFRQPSLELMLELYDPLINRLAIKQHEHWKQYEICDLCQICRLVMITLYNKGYYLHKRLIEKAFVNELLMELRSERNKPSIVSLDDIFYKPASVSGSDDITFADIIADESDEIAEKEQSIHDAELAIFEEIKDIIIDLIGVRQWNEFYRDYANGHTTAWSRKIMLKIKNRLNTLGLTRGKFNDKYYK